MSTCVVSGDSLLLGQLSIKSVDNLATGPAMYIGCVDVLTAGSLKSIGSVDSQAAWRGDYKGCVNKATAEFPEHVTNVERVYDSDCNKV